MRYAVGTLALVAAAVIVIYSAATLFQAAYTSMSAPWAAMMAGIGIAAVVAWEAGAALLIGGSFRSGHYAIGIGAMLLLVLAMGLTFRYELRLHVGGQADVIATRDDAAARQVDLRSELESARKRRDHLASIARPTYAQRDQLREERVRIEALERRWDARVETIAEPMPEAALAARLTGMSETSWRDIWLIVPLGFWMLARVFAFPLAVVGMTAVKNRDVGSGAAKPLRAALVQDRAPLPSGISLERPDLARKALPPSTDDTPPPAAAAKPIITPEPQQEEAKPHLVVSNPEAMSVKPHSKAERLEAIDVITKRWLEQATVPVALEFGLPAKPLHDAYSRWCIAWGVMPVNNSHFGRSVKRLAVKKGKTKDGARYGLKLKEIAKAAA